jgi:hypothetical protein
MGNFKIITDKGVLSFDTEEERAEYIRKKMEMKK